MSLFKRNKNFWFTAIILLLTGCGSVGTGDNNHRSSSSLASNQTNTTTDPPQDISADLVLGQVDFVHSGTNAGGGAGFVTDVGLNDPSGVAIDRSVIPNRIYVADYNNNRVLGWADISTLTNGSPADLVIGQPDFSTRVCNNGGSNASSLCAPEHLAVDSVGDLYVADRGNSRVLVYFKPNFPPDPPGPPGTIGDTVADLVIGQPNLTSSGCSNPSVNTASASSLCAPTGVAVDGAGNVYVADMVNNRVLEYDNPLGSCSTCDMVADRVFGQPDFTTRTAGVGDSGLNQPNDVAVDGGGNLYVADFQNHRVLEYNTPLTTDTVADRVFGQPNFSSNSANEGAGITSPSASGLSYPIGIAVDPAGNLYVAERGNSRVLEFDMPLITDAVGDLVFGQPDFTHNGCDRAGVSASSLCLPFGVAIDSEDNLWVADFANNRVLRYGNPGGPPPPPTSDEVTIPSASFHFEEHAAYNCSLQSEVEFSFEKRPGDPSSGDAGHTTNDIVSSSVIATMTFPDGSTAEAVPEDKEDERSNPHPPYLYAFEFEVMFDCSTMTAHHVFTDQDVTIHVSGTLSDGHTFSGTGVIKTHP